MVHIYLDFLQVFVKIIVLNKAIKAIVECVFLDFRKAFDNLSKNDLEI